MTFDVSARLAQGAPSVANTQAYVSACRAVGYRHPDLTAHPAAVLDWYGAVEGLDLQALDADCATLRAAGAAADEALTVQRAALAALSAVWDGQSGSWAENFIIQHCDAGATVAGGVHAAAEACTTLRDTLWRLVDQRVEAAVSIDQRCAGERSAWLAAAAIVTGGAGERAEAVEVVTRQITPYVDADVRGEWVSAMRSSTTGMADAYDDAIRRLATSPAVHFAVPDVPGLPAGASSTSPLGEPSGPVGAVPVARNLPVQPAVSAPSIAEPTPGLLVSPEAIGPQPLPPAAAAGPPTLPDAGTVTPAGIPGMPDVAGGLSGLVGQITDVLAGLFGGSLGAPVGDPLSDLDVAAGDDARDEPEDTGEDTGEDTDPGREDDSVEPADMDAQDVPVTESVADPQPAAPEPAVPAVAPAPPRQEPPPAEGNGQPTGRPGERTPCEIAADELPQVGQ